MHVWPACSSAETIRNIVVCPPDPGPGGAQTQATVSGSPGTTGSGSGSTQPSAAISPARSMSSRTTGRRPLPGGATRLITRVARRAATPVAPSLRSSRRV
jgi:hypothetical protein